MCDYSLHNINNRLAVEGETLFVHTFYTGSKGLASMTDLENPKKWSQLPAGAGWWKKIVTWLDDHTPSMNVTSEASLPAVCIPPGARLDVQNIPARLQKKFNLCEREEVVFTQLTDKPYVYRDALQFHNGCQILIQQLNEGLQIKVLSLALPEDVDEFQDVSSLEFEWAEMR
jgi:hypothetical protein